jgi:hypothetical protein
MNSRTWIALEFKLADFWVGLFWQTKPANYHTIDGRVSAELHVYICLVPCLPVHVVRAIV